jgi:plasmid rolling circle replication initiator protein Rep
MSTRGTRGTTRGTRGTTRGTRGTTRDTLGEEYNMNDKILQDTKNGKLKDWSGKRMKSENVKECFDRIELYGRGERMFHCGTFLRFNNCDKDGYKKLVAANFCRDRLCPMCNWRRSLMLHGQILTVLHAAQAQQKMRYIFLTLTVKNANDTNLDDRVSELLGGFKALFDYKDVDKVVVGYVRNLEITYNKKDDTYHPHIHVLIGVKPSYFNDKYLSQKDWTSLFQRAAKLDYTPIVHVQAVKPNREGQTVEGAVAETAKYSVKDSDYIHDDKNLMDKIVSVLAETLKGRRLIAYGKLFRKVHKELHLSDINTEKADLIGNDHSGCLCPICNSTLISKLYKWHVGVRNYVEVI